MTEPADGDELLDRATTFGAEIVETLRSTICPTAEMEAEVFDDRVHLAPPLDPAGASQALPLTIDGRSLVDLRLSWWLTWDHQKRFLAVHESKFSLSIPHDREPLVRVEYERDRSYAPAHIQVHAESGALGLLLAFHPSQRPPKFARLHLPVGDRGFRPCLEDVIEMAVRDLNVDAQDGWLGVVERRRAVWKALQTKAAVRDLLRADPGQAAELRQMLDEVE